MGIDFYDRMYEEEQKEKERFGQRKNEIENELFSQRRRIEELEKENEDLKKQIEQMKCCGNCQSVFDADGSCYLYKDRKCVDHSEWVKNEYNLVKKEKNNE